MKRSWLVQRLRKPLTSGVLGMKDNPFSFGGGLRNGGLTAEAMDLLRGIWSFDYMGSAEFEFGAVPKALQQMAREELVACQTSIDLATVPAGWRSRKNPPPISGSATLFVLCPAVLEAEVLERISEWARGTERLKEATRLTSALRPENDWDKDTVGWLELDNGFAFFTDREMWLRTADLFSVKIEAAA